MSLMLNTNHPVEEVNRMLLAALIKHLGLGHLVIKILSESIFSTINLYLNYIKNE